MTNDDIRRMTIMKTRLFLFWRHTLYSRVHSFLVFSRSHYFYLAAATPLTYSLIFHSHVLYNQSNLIITSCLYYRRLKELLFNILGYLHILFTYKDVIVLIIICLNNLIIIAIFIGLRIFGIVNWYIDI